MESVLVSCVLLRCERREREKRNRVVGTGEKLTW
jgi:hypothetical protein